MASPQFSYMPEELEACQEEKKVSDLLEFLHVVGLLKRTLRSGWVLRGVKSPESVSDHMYRMSIITLLCEDADIDRNKAAKMALVHDIAEAITGDITPMDGVSAEEKMSRESEAMERLQTLLKSNRFGNEMVALWQEYEEGTSAEAMLVKDIDKFEMILQAFEYEKEQDTQLQEFFTSTEGKFRTPFVIELVKELYVQRANHRLGME